MLQRLQTWARESQITPLLAAGLAVGIFVVDTFSPHYIAIAVLYIAIVLLSAEFAGRRGIVAVAAGCVGLTLLSFAITHGEDFGTDAIMRALVAIAAITITAILAMRAKQTMERLGEQASLLDLTHDMIFVRNLDDVITYWNRGAQEHYGWRNAEAVGRKTAELLKTRFPAATADIMDELMRTGRWEGELAHVRRDGSRTTVASRWALQRDERGRPMAILETNNDVTERRQAEDALLKAQAELAHVSRVATMGELTASIAHEVNQPLAAVVTNGEACLRWLRRDVPDIGEARKSVERIIHNGRRASDVVANLRALASRAEPDYLPIDVVEVVDDAARLLRRELASHRVVLSLEAPQALPRIRGDRVQLQQVIINLLVNGMQAMDAVAEGPRRLSIVAGRGGDPDQVVVTVSDTGPGLAPDDLSRVFNAFFTTKSQGMGMGLSICRSIVEAHGGRVWATSHPGAGASFHVSIPALEEVAA
jgi:PAS domain S-box-containing protein